MRRIFLIISVLIMSVIFFAACIRSELETLENQNEIEFTEIETETEMERVEIYVDYFMLENIEEMADSATDIISGRVLDRRVEWVNVRPSRESVEERMFNQGMSQEEIDFELYGIDFEPYFELRTIHRVQVLEVFQGNLIVDEIVEVTRPGGEYDNQYWFVADAIELIIDTEYVLFLFASRIANNRFSLFNPVQGVYYTPHTIMGYEYLVEYDNIELELEKASELDPVTVTIGDLINIAAENGLLEE